MSRSLAQTHHAPPFARLQFPAPSLILPVWSLICFTNTHTHTHEVKKSIFVPSVLKNRAARNRGTSGLASPKWGCIPFWPEAARICLFFFAVFHFPLLRAPFIAITIVTRMCLPDVSSHMSVYTGTLFRSFRGWPFSTGTRSLTRSETSNKTTLRRKRDGNARNGTKRNQIKQLTEPYTAAGSRLGKRVERLCNKKNEKDRNNTTAKKTFL